MSGPREPREGDVEAVGRFIDAHQAYQAAAQRVGRARDAVAAAHQPVRDVDRASEAAARRLAAIDAAQAATADRVEALAQLRELAVRGAQDREKARGSGPAAGAAAERQGRYGFDLIVYRERVAELTARAAEAAAVIGTDDPAEWARLRERDQATIDGYRERRRAAIERSSEQYPAARERLAAAEAAVTAVGDQREAAAADLAERGIDAQRIVEAAERVGREGAQSGVEDRTGPAFEAWRERQQYQQRAAELDEERQRQRPSNGHELER